MVQIAIRRKTFPKKLKPAQLSDEEDDEWNDLNSNSKLHIKSLEAGLRVKLTLAPSLMELYQSLTPHNNRQLDMNQLQYDGETKHEKVSPSIELDNQEMTNKNTYHKINKLGKLGKLISKSVQLIDNNLVNLSKTSNKVLQNYFSDSKTNDDNVDHSKDIDSISSPASPRISKKTNQKKKLSAPSFNSLSTAVHVLFGLSEFTLVRVTRSTTTNLEGSVVLKLETAKPGDYKLFDDSEFLSEMIHSIGHKNTVPSNLFLKKIVARPRYKSDMKIYLIPKNYDSSLYVDERMFERDLINGIIDFEKPLDRNIFSTFNPHNILLDFKNLLDSSQKLNDLNKSDKSPLKLNSDEAMSPSSSSASGGSASCYSSQFTPILENSNSRASYISNDDLNSQRYSDSLPLPPPTSSTNSSTSSSANSNSTPMLELNRSAPPPTPTSLSSLSLPLLKFIYRPLHSNRMPPLIPLGIPFNNEKVGDSKNNLRNSNESVSSGSSGSSASLLSDFNQKTPSSNSSATSVHSIERLPDPKTNPNSKNSMLPPFKSILNYIQNDQTDQYVQK